MCSRQEVRRIAGEGRKNRNESAAAPPKWADWTAATAVVDADVFARAVAGGAVGGSSEQAPRARSVPATIAIPPRVIADLLFETRIGLVRAVARGSGEVPGGVRQCSGKQRTAKHTLFRSDTQGLPGTIVKCGAFEHSRAQRGPSLSVVYAIIRDGKTSQRSSHPL